MGSFVASCPSQYISRNVSISACSYAVSLFPKIFRATAGVMGRSSSSNKGVRFGRLLRLVDALDDVDL